MGESGYWGKKSLVVVTGASQGIGRSIAVHFAGKIGSSSKIILTARSLANLKQTKSLVKQRAPDIDVIVESMDMEKPDCDILVNAMGLSGKEDEFQVYMLVHNAGTEGNGDLTVNMTSIDEWNRYMTLNVFSAAALTGKFISNLPQSIKDNGGAKVVIINITSLAAIKSIPGLGYYCVGKSAREMYFNTLAEENKYLQVLNYSPGPVDTEMQERVVDCLKVEETKSIFTKMKSDQTLLTLDQSIGKLVSILDGGLKSSPCRADYFD